MPCDTEKTKEQRYPRVMFAAPESGSGKTVITCGFLELFRRCGMNAVSFKCGPDYIDPLFHCSVTGTPGINLDSFFLERDDIVSLFERKAGNASISVIEGVMGYYDGLAGKSLTASSFDIADILDCPVILILDVKKQAEPPEQVLKKLLDRMPENHIKGVILNRATREYAHGLRLKLETLGVRFYGYVPECAGAVIKSRHLGLDFSSDREKFIEKIFAFSDIIKETTDVDGIVELAKNSAPLTGMSNKAREQLPPENGKAPAQTASGRTGPSLKKETAAVARDEAFCFTYADNLDFLRESGYDITFFSPLHDRELPKGASVIILSGGYPEVYAAELSANTAMIRSVREAFGRVKMLAECGGFLYLNETLEGTDHSVFPMTGCIKADAFRTDRSSRFGYISLYGDGNFLIKGHEFHYWDSTAPGCDLTAVKPITGRSWDCVYLTPVLLAGFPHLYYRSGPSFIREFLKGERLC